MMNVSKLALALCCAALAPLCFAVPVDAVKTEEVKSPEIEEESVGEVGATSAALHARVAPNGAPTSVYFQYSTSDTASCTATTCASAPEPPGVSISSSGEVEVPTQTVQGLVPATVYHYRVVMVSSVEVEMEPGKRETRTEEFDGPDETFTTQRTQPLGPVIQEGSVVDVGSDAATFRARIEPNGGSTSVYFQYSTSDTASCPATCASLPSSPGVSIGSSGEVEVPAQTVQGLVPATVYHYRVVAISGVEVAPGHVESKTFYGPDQTFTTQWQGAFALPDERQWEMVSPPEKEGARIAGPGEEGGLSGGNTIQAAADGQAITYIAYAPTEASTPGYAGDVQVFSARGPDGWRSWDLNGPHEQATGSSRGNEYGFFSEDLSTGILQPMGPFIAATPREEAEPLSPEDRALAPDEATEQTAFVHINYLDGDPAEHCERPTADCYRPLVSAREPYNDLPAGTTFGGDAEQCEDHRPFCGPRFIAATPNGKHVVLEMTPEPGQSGLYEWSEGKLEFIAGGEDGLGKVTTVGGSSNARHAISENGSRVFWQGEGDNTPKALYMTEPERGRTVQLDLHAPECAGSCGSGHGEFQDASADGSRVFFTDTERLTSDAGGVLDSPDLYECHIVEKGGTPSCELTDLTPRDAGGEGADVLDLIAGASENGETVYFVANGVLENGGKPARNERESAVQGDCSQYQSSAGAECNLYVRENDETRLVAVLSGADAPDWSGGGGLLYDLTGRVSADGRWFAFMSQRPLTGYDNRDEKSGQPDEEAYLYDAATSSLVCASCNPTGARPHGERFDIEGTSEFSMPLVTGKVGWAANSWLAASLPAWNKVAYASEPAEATYQTRYLSDNGRLFFDSDDALVPQDNNDNWDVYEYEPPGVGSCEAASATFSPRSDGCVDLISSGTFAGESAFMDASATGGREAEGNEGGGDVFFVTAAQLSTRDKDDALDVYDAHECTASSPCLPPTAEQPPPCSSADACRAAPTPQPSVFGAPASETFSGPGNLSPAPPVVKSKTAAQSRAEKLVGALKACRSKRDSRKRAACEASARRRYGAPHKASGSKGKGQAKKAGTRSAGR